MKKLGLLMLVMLLLVGCGGVADTITTQHLDLRVSRRGRVLPDHLIAVAMRGYKDTTVFGSQQIVTDASGTAHAGFKVMTGSAFFVIPPVGNVPSRPPKPSYAIMVDGKQAIVSPENPGILYQWKRGSWRTEATVDIH